MSREFWLAEVAHSKLGLRMPRRISSGLGCIKGLLVGLLFWVGAYVVGDIWL